MNRPLAVAAGIGIDAGQAVTYHCDSQGLDRVYGAVSKRMCCMRKGGDRNDAAWRADVDTDFSAR